MAEHLRCQQVEPVVITHQCKDKTCPDCNRTLPIEQFPTKGKGRRVSRCNECHNHMRRSRYTKIPRRSGEIDFKLTHLQFNERHEGFNLLLELVCDDVLKGFGV